MAGLTGRHYAFTQDNASKAPDEDGVYQIEDDARIIYIGSGNIRDRLLSHLLRENQADACIFRNAPTRYRREPCANCRDREQELLRQCQTSCNQRVG